MLRFVLLGICQSLLLASGQVFLKLAMNRMGSFQWTWTFFKDSVLLNWPLAASGAGLGCATVLWLYILRHFDFSLAYPITSFSYVFGLFAALIVFHEPVPLSRWIGVLLIMAGVFFLTRQ